MKIVSFRVTKKRRGAKRVKRQAPPALKSIFARLPKPPARVSAFFASRKKVRILLMCAAVALLLLLLPFSGPGQAVMAAALKRDLPIYCVQKDSSVVSLSFDAAWGNGILRYY